MFFLTMNPYLIYIFFLGGGGGGGGGRQVIFFTKNPNLLTNLTFI